MIKKKFKFFEILNYNLYFYIKNCFILNNEKKA